VDDASFRIARKHNMMEHTASYQAEMTAYLCELLLANGARGLYRECAGGVRMPALPVVGVLEKNFFVRLGYSVDEVYACYCYIVEGSACATEQQPTTNSPEYHYIQSTLELASALGPPSTRAGGEVDVSLGVSCDTAALGVALGWRARRADGYRTGPFDLMLSNYEGLVQCMRDDFRHFTDPAHLGGEVKGWLICIL
jgi:hypothetical protein